MKVALITTTINVPHVLKLYRAVGKDVGFFVALDKKSVDPERLPDGTLYLTPDEQTKWKCSELIGWNTVARRNIALLEALKWGADVIVSVDDDNAPMGRAYFDEFKQLFADFTAVAYGTPAADINPASHPRKWNGIEAACYWFDPGQLQFPRDGIDPVVQRGFPQERMSMPTFKPRVDARIGVAQGMILGDPDTSAVDRISRHPIVHQVSELLRSGLVTNPRGTWTVMNSQNLAFIRELAPCFLMAPQFQRYDDIFASMVAQRVMREHDLFVHFGHPFVWQERNDHHLNSDLMKEIWGMDHTIAFADFLDRCELPTGRSVRPLEQVRSIYQQLKEQLWIPEGVSELGAAWCDDLEKVL